jgi:asparagine synthase (glutamine-hydrolysing)
VCGINGIYVYSPAAAARADRAELLRTREQMAARGPDSAGEWFSDDGRLALGHRRLAIIDPTPAGIQPMRWADGGLTITFNGEIYNFAELRGELQAAGHRFATHTDTEVLLHLYRRHGAAMVDRLRGMFAFAIWDEQDRSLFLARDPYGIKPLYFADDGRTFRFASQHKALLAGGEVARAVSPGGLVGFLLWGSVPSPLTISRDIRILPAGSTLTVREGVGAGGPRSYWTLAGALRRSVDAARALPVGQEEELAHAAFRDSVRAHMVSDVPVGAFLSAGMDSSTVVGLARTSAGAPLMTVTLTSQGLRGSHLDEGPGAQALARFLQVDHRLLEVDTTEFDVELDRFLEAMDQPTIDGLNTWFVSKAAHEAGLKVALSGLGGDELLGGYWTFRTVPTTVARMRALRSTPRLANALRVLHERVAVPAFRAEPVGGARLALGSTFPGAYAAERGMLRPWQLPGLLDRSFLRQGMEELERATCPELLSEDFEALPPFGKVMVLEGTRYMRNQLLRDSDWTGMAHSLEIRVPLVDRTLTECIGGLSALGRLGDDKSVLARALSPPIPRELLDRAKTGFTLPIWKWLRHSDLAQGWRTVPLLGRRSVHDYSRWAYVLLSRSRLVDDAVWARS